MNHSLNENEFTRQRRGRESYPGREGIKWVKARDVKWIGGTLKAEMSIKAEEV